MLNYQSMNKAIKTLIGFAIIFIGLLAVSVSFVQGQYGPYEGVAPAGQILVDKKIRNPWAQKGAANEYVDNLGLQPEDYHFAPGEKVDFRIIVKNTGNTTFEKVEVKDTLPQYLDYVLGSGDVNREIRDITFSYGELKPDKTWTIEFSAKVFPADEIPNEQTTICVLNKAEGWANNQYDDDTTQLCLTKEKVLGVQPPAGANLFPLGLSCLGISALGFYFRKKLAL